MWNYFVFSTIVVITSLLIRQNLKTPLSIIEHPEARYDYIIVGAGTAGCVIASRLSKNSNITVLLVEAGGYLNWLSSIPLAAPVLQKSYMDWSYKTKSQLFSSKGLWNYQQIIPRGKGLGGSGQLNYLVHSFGEPKDYSHWPPSWSHAELEPYFQRVAKLMQVRTVAMHESLADAMRIAEDKMQNSGARFIQAQSTVVKGARWSTYHSHLQSAWNRPNLHILINTRVTRILLDVTNKIEGVKLHYENGIHEKIEAKEVILCAGAINTPHLLMISGIGPTDQLKKYKIPLKIDIPGIGKNYADHFNMPVYVKLKTSVSITLEKLQSISTIIEYFLFGTGLLASNGIIAIARLNESSVILAGVGSVDENLLKSISNYRTKTFRSLFPTYSNPKSDGFVFMSNCLQPMSRGNITLRSSNVFDQPIIEPAFLERYEDVACTINAIRFALSIVNTSLFREFGAEVHVPNLEECQNFKQDYQDDAFAECVIRVAALTSHHPSGTCKMGNSIDDAVVDEFLKVHGIRGLRIVDASVLPAPVSGTPNSVIIVIAERTADIILKSIKFKP